eukprot:Rmarinus@m.9195
MKKGGGEGIQVFARFRPFSNSELKRPDNKPLVSFPDSQTVMLDSPLLGMIHNFTFDRCFPMETTQEEIYSVVNDRIEDAINGYNVTIFAYGQTGTGKTHTMTGTKDNAGVIPRMMNGLFQYIRSNGQGQEFSLKCSYMEIYNEKARDLLRPSKKDIKVREKPGHGVFVENLCSEAVTCAADISDLLTIGERARRTAATKMNSHSSRSHSLFVMTIEQKALDGSGVEKKSRINLVDLAGSEKVSKTGAEGLTLEEAKKINRSLSTLSMCIQKLSSGKGDHIPYRDSLLTHALKESLGGNTKTSVFVTCSPHSCNMEETLSSLRFGQSASKIVLSVHVNKAVSLEGLQQELSALKKQVFLLRQYAPSDVVANLAQLSNSSPTPQTPEVQSPLGLEAPVPNTPSTTEERPTVLAVDASSSGDKVDPGLLEKSKSAPKAMDSPTKRDVHCQVMLSSSTEPDVVSTDAVQSPQPGVGSCLRCGSPYGAPAEAEVSQPIGGGPSLLPALSSTPQPVETPAPEVSVDLTRSASPLACASDCDTPRRLSLDDARSGISLLSGEGDVSDSQSHIQPQDAETEQLRGMYEAVCERLREVKEDLAMCSGQLEGSNSALRESESMRKVAEDTCRAAEQDAAVTRTRNEELAVKLLEVNAAKQHLEFENEKLATQLETMLRKWEDASRALDDIQRQVEANRHVSGESAGVSDEVLRDINLLETRVSVAQQEKVTAEKMKDAMATLFDKQLREMTFKSLEAQKGATLLDERLRGEKSQKEAAQARAFTLEKQMREEAKVAAEFERRVRRLEAEREHLSRQLQAAASLPRTSKSRTRSPTWDATSQFGASAAAALSRVGGYIRKPLTGGISVLENFRASRTQGDCSIPEVSAAAESAPTCGSEENTKSCAPAGESDGMSAATAGGDDRAAGLHSPAIETEVVGAGGAATATTPSGADVSPTATGAPPVKGSLKVPDLAAVQNAVAGGVKDLGTGVKDLSNSLYSGLGWLGKRASSVSLKGAAAFSPGARADVTGAESEDGRTPLSGVGDGDQRLQPPPGASAPL